MHKIIKIPSSQKRNLKTNLHIKLSAKLSNFPREYLRSSEKEAERSFREGFGGPNANIEAPIET